MSFFLGKGSGGNNILHITKGENTIPEMLGGVRDNTVFHSNLPLSSYKLIPLTQGSYYSYDKFVTYGGWVDLVSVQTCFTKYKNQNTSYDYIPISGARAYTMNTSDYSSLISQLQTKPNRVLFLDSNYKIVTNCGIGQIMSLHSFGSYGWDFSTTFSTSYTFAIATFYQEVVTPIVSYILLIYDDYYPSISGAIKIDNSGLFMNSTNFFLNRNLISNTQNTGAVKVFDNLYLITTPTSVLPGDFIISTVSGNTTMTLRGITIFSSLYNSYMPFKINTLRSITKSVVYGYSPVDTLLYTMSANENFAIVGFKLVAVSVDTTVYCFIGRGSSNVVLLNYGANDTEPYAILITYVYMSGGNVYIRGKTGGNSITKSRVFTLETF